MDLVDIGMPILIGLGLLCLLLYNLLGPKEAWDPEEGLGLLMRLKKRRERLLRTIKDLEFARESGTLSEEEFRQLRNDYKLRVIAASKGLERVRRSRLRNLMKRSRAATPSQKRHIEELVKARREAQKAAGLILLVLGICASLAGSRLEGAVVLKGRAFDGSASAQACRSTLSQGKMPDENLKTPLAEKDLTVDLIDLDKPSGGSKSPGSWHVKTDSGGNFTLETGLVSLPENAYLVLSVEADGKKLYSPFVRATGEARSFHLYPTTESSANLKAAFKAVYDVQEDGAVKSLRVRISLQLLNRGGEMYVGRQDGTPWRHVWRLPVPSGAKVLLSRGPGDTRWTSSGDGRWLLLDSPIPGICDYDQMGSCEVHYILPLRQLLLQTFPVCLSLEDPSQVSFWCPHQDMKLESAQLNRTESAGLPDPFTGQQRQFEVSYSDNHKFRAGEEIKVALTVDNAAAGQISRGAVKWVGGFVLVIILGMLLGLALGPRGPSPDALLESLSGEQILDRIAELDARFERKAIGPEEYRRYREPLVELALEELGEGGEKDALLRSSVLPASAREILRRIGEIEQNGTTSPERISERAHLLEALAKTLLSEAGGGQRSLYPKSGDKKSHDPKTRDQGSPDQRSEG
jgi:hypothetical protein